MKDRINSNDREDIILKQNIKVKIKTEGYVTKEDWDDYTTQRSECEFFCNKNNHGSFTSKLDTVVQTKYNGCSKCKSEIEFEKFKIKAFKLHGDKYSYYKSAYKCSRTKMGILCNKHDIIFPQRPSAHLQGQGCYICGWEETSRKKLRDLEGFVQQAKEVHGSLYDYSDSVYLSAKKPIDIFCNIHKKPFRVAAAQNHLLGQGCRICSSTNSTTEEFIETSKEMFGDRFDYKDVDYINNTTEVILTCKMHNCKFPYKPVKHLYKGRYSGGCRYCGKMSSGRWSISKIRNIPEWEKLEGYYYIGKISGIDSYKLGVTKHLTTRATSYRQDLKTYPDNNFEYLNHLKSDYLSSFILEQLVKDTFKEKHDFGITIKFGGINEMFTLEEGDLAFINNLMENDFIKVVEKESHNITSKSCKEYKSLLKVFNNLYNEFIKEERDVKKET